MGYQNEDYSGNSKRVCTFRLTTVVYLISVAVTICLHYFTKMCSLMYLHEGLEPKVVHRDVKSSNILLDKHWHAKLSDFGLAKLLGSERSYVTTRVMGTFGLDINTTFKIRIMQEKQECGGLFFILLLAGMLHQSMLVLVC